MQAIIQTIVLSFSEIVFYVKVIRITRPSFISPVVQFVFKEAQFVFLAYRKLTDFFRIPVDIFINVQTAVL